MTWHQHGAEDEGEPPDRLLTTYLLRHILPGILIIVISDIEGLSGSGVIVTTTPVDEHRWHMRPLSSYVDFREAVSVYSTRTSIISAHALFYRTDRKALGWMKQRPKKEFRSAQPQPSAHPGANISSSNLNGKELPTFSKLTPSSSTTAHTTITMPPTIARAALRPAFRRTGLRHASSTTEAAKDKAKDTASQATSKASEGLSKVQSSASSGASRASEAASSAASGITGRVSRAVGFVRCE